MAWVTPKTNWVSTDYYNFNDINRVENNIEYVRSELLAIGYSVPSMTIIKTRTAESYDLLSSINRLETNLQTLTGSFITPPGWLPTTLWQVSTKLSEYHANRWESNVSLLHDYVALTTQAYRYAGTFAAGQGVPI